MKFHIVEFDKDYRTISGFEEKEFETLEEAEEWCKTNSWTGYDYFIDTRYHK